MAVHRIKKRSKTRDKDDLEEIRPVAYERDLAAELAAPESEDEEFIAAPERTPYGPDPREVDNLTDRIFASVLSRYGWVKQNGRIEHVGERQQVRR
ncbi:MAG: hypothetical protein ACE14L_13195 [Terriglobales bacterium]